MKGVSSRVRSAEPKYKVRAYSPSFLVDAMLGNIARKLRIFGYDTLYLKDTSDTSVLGIASREKRILLTRDKELFRRVIKEGIDGVLLEEYDEDRKYRLYFVKIWDTIVYPSILGLQGALVATEF